MRSGAVPRLARARQRHDLPAGDDGPVGVHYPLGGPPVPALHESEGGAAARSAITRRVGLVTLLTRIAHHARSGWHGCAQDVPLVRPAAGMALYETVTGDLTLFVGNGDHFLMIDVRGAAMRLACRRSWWSADWGARRVASGGRPPARSSRAWRPRLRTAPRPSLAACASTSSRSARTASSCVIAVRGPASRKRRHRAARTTKTRADNRQPCNRLRRRRRSGWYHGQRLWQARRHHYPLARAAARSPCVKACARGTCGQRPRALTVGVSLGLVERRGGASGPSARGHRHDSPGQRPVLLEPAHRRADAEHAVRVPMEAYAGRDARGHDRRWPRPC